MRRTLGRRWMLALPVVLPLAVVAAPAAGGVVAEVNVGTWGQALGGGIDARRFDVELICKWFGVDPALIGHSERASSDTDPPPVA